MMQICKNNSIQGSKLASCRMVYTCHSNLKKTFDMDSGTVTYHDTKQCRYGRCEKDRPRIKQLEKTKSEDITVDFYEEFQENQRRMIKRRKEERKQRQSVGGHLARDDNELYDPVLDDLKTRKLRAKRQGDESSGIDAALESLGLAKGTPDTEHGYDQSTTLMEDSTVPLWKQEDQRRQAEGNEDLVFLSERGYPMDRAKSALEEHGDPLEALRALFFALGDATFPTGEPSTEQRAARSEEKEVLQAIFGEDDPSVRFGDAQDDLDSVLPIVAYQAPDRYDEPPPLLVEIYTGKTDYPDGAPVLAIRGGGLCEKLLEKLTGELLMEASSNAAEEPGEPQIFNLLQLTGERAEMLVEEEGIELQKQKEEAQKAKQAAFRRKEEAAFPPSQKTFQSQADRRAYAQKIVGTGPHRPVESEKKTEKNHYNTGVSDISLVEDLFG